MIGQIPQLKIPATTKGNDMNEELKEAQQIHAKTQELIETLMGGGIAQRTIIVAMNQALLERWLLDSGVDGAQRFLRDQADQLDDWGPQFVALSRQR